VGSGRSRKEAYAFSDAEKDAALAALLGLDGPADVSRALRAGSGGRVSVQRFKGLGEMMPEQLWTTTMNPETRTLLQVTVSDANLADQTLSLLMGDSAAPRRNFISTQAENLSMDDLDL
jgi:DNA gyrase subunit B